MDAMQTAPSSGLHATHQ